MSDVAITSTPASGDTYAADEDIQVTVTFDAAVTVTGTPALRIDIGCNKKDDGDCQRAAKYLSGSDSTALVFQYTVKKTDVDTDGISISKNAIRRNGGDIKKGADKVKLIHDAVAADSGHKVDGGAETIGARVSSVAITSTPASGDTYARGENIQVTVTFDAAVTVTGTPRLQIYMGCTEEAGCTRAKYFKRKAGYHSGSTTTALVFQYTVKKADVDADGISISKNSIRRKDGDIKKGADKVTLTHDAVPIQAGHKVNGGS